MRSTATTDTSTRASTRWSSGTWAPTPSPTVNLRWEIDERNPAIVNRIEIVGNDYTVEDCIRRQIFLVPGGVFNQRRWSAATRASAT